MYDDYNYTCIITKPNVYGEKFVLRLLKKDINIRNIFDLGLPATEKRITKKYKIKKKQYNNNGSTNRRR